MEPDLVKRQSTVEAFFGKVETGSQLLTAHSWHLS
jgi:hypothetical protein